MICFFPLEFILQTPTSHPMSNPTGLQQDSCKIWPVTILFSSKVGDSWGNSLAAGEWPNSYFDHWLIPISSLSFIVTEVDILFLRDLIKCCCKYWRVCQTECTPVTVNCIYEAWNSFTAVNFIPGLIRQIFEGISQVKLGPE